MVPNNPTQPIDMEAARRAISFDLRSACASLRDDELIAEIDRITDRAARLGICRQRWEVDPRFAPKAARVKQESGKRLHAAIPGIGDIGRI